MIICKRKSKAQRFSILLLGCLLFVFSILPIAVYSADKVVDSPQERLDSLKALTASALTPQKAFETAVIGLDLSDELIRQKYFTEASKAAFMAKVAAKNAKNSYLYKSCVYYSKYARSVDSYYQRVEKSLADLKSNPANKEAALEVGLFYCLHNWDWAKGLPILRKCSDSLLVKLALMEQQFPSIAVDQIKLGDLWAQYANEGDPKNKTAIKQRAKYWYLKALPKLSMLKQASLVKRIKQIPKQTFQLNIAVRIDGSDSLVLSEEQLEWHNHSFQYPSILVMNGIRWETKQSVVLANQGGTRVLPHHIHLTSVRLKKKSGRGPVSMKINDGRVQITFDDSKPGGASDYVVTLSFDTF